MHSQWKDKIFSTDEAGFEELALEIFHFQYKNNVIYREYSDALHVIPENVRAVTSIPFLPVRFFKSHIVQATSFEPGVIFESSGTTSTITSRHFVKDTGLYKESFTRSFELFYGSPKEWCIIGLLPSYLERKDSSLVYMVNELVLQSGHADSGFYLNEYDKLFAVFKQLEKKKQKTFLIGVAFALLDFAEKYSVPLRYTIVMETGGMKGRREELVREEMHDILKKSFQVPVIHSEYGMTELLSQAYSKGDGKFKCPPWMKVLVRDDEDPLLVSVPRFETVTPITGAINIIDLANIYSCSFIAADDAGRIFPDGTFEVLGRIDNSDLRGCSLMAI